MMYYYHYSCLELPMALADFQVEGCPLRLHHVCHRDYVVLNDIDFDGAERSRRFIVIVLTSYGDRASQRN